MCPIRSASVLALPPGSPKLTAGLAGLKLEHTALQSKHELAVADLEQQLSEARKALQESEHASQKSANAAEQLKTTRVELVSEC